MGTAVAFADETSPKMVTRLGIEPRTYGLRVNSLGSSQARIGGAQTRFWSARCSTVSGGVLRCSAVECQMECQMAFLGNVKWNVKMVVAECLAGPQIGAAECEKEVKRWSGRRRGRVVGGRVVGAWLGAGVCRPLFVGKEVGCRRWKGAVPGRLRGNFQFGATVCQRALNQIFRRTLGTVEAVVNSPSE